MGHTYRAPLQYPKRELALSQAHADRSVVERFCSSGTLLCPRVTPCLGVALSWRYQTTSDPTDARDLKSNQKIC